MLPEIAKVNIVFKFGRKKWRRPAARLSEMRNVYKHCT
jgi:ribosomal protein L32E